jgi:hypothetical protein
MAYLERSGMSDQSFVKSLQHRRNDPTQLDLADLPFSPAFFVHPQSCQRFVDSFESHFPHLKSGVIAQADAILAHEFKLLGSGRVKLGAKIDWHRDFKSGYRWDPGTYFDDYQRIRSEDDSDIKVTRELSRFQHLTVLGKAYWLSRDERYPREFVGQLADWMVENPPMFSINWDCAMDVAIRAVNWIWGYYFFATSSVLTADFRKQFTKSLLSHGRFIFQTLEYYEAPVEGKIQRLNSNHYLSDLAGLIFIALACPFFKESSRWLDYAKGELFTEIEEQVYPSGVDYEHSVSYHRLVLELFLFTFLLLKTNGHVIPEAAWERLEKMFEYVLYYTKPDGCHPLVGDADDGRLVILNDSPIHSHRYLLSLGAVLFGRSDMKAASRGLDETCLWTLGPSAPVSFQNLPVSDSNLGSKSFPDAQFFVMRADDAYLFVDAADIGIRGRGSHDHNDRLSFELHWKSTTFFSDSGAYLYSACPELRNRFRSTRAHNTVLLDGVEQNTLGKGLNLWTIGNEAKPSVHRWETGRESDFLKVSHVGYQRLTDPVSHVREFLFEKPIRWRITDELAGEGAHTVEWFFHLGPLVVPLCDSDDLLLCLYRGLSLRGNGGDLLHFRIKPDVAGLSAEALEDWVSPSYGIKTNAITIHLHGLLQLPLKVEFEIYG